VESVDEVQLFAPSAGVRISRIITRRRQDLLSVQLQGQLLLEVLECPLERLAREVFLPFGGRQIAARDLTGPKE
jgi:hypothetical protein